MATITLNQRVAETVDSITGTIAGEVFWAANGDHALVVAEDTIIFVDSDGDTSSADIQVLNSRTGWDA